jgi:pimeloyl-ACP methyl ester carboxylesterase
MIQALSCFLLLLVASSALAGPKEFYYQRYLRKFEEQRDPLKRMLRAPTKSGVFEQRVNPADASDDRVFGQRYFVNSGYAQGADAPVLYVICGEATCSENDFRGAIVGHAQALGAHMVALEHRYYGKSQPFSRLTAANLKYLTTENAIADLASFQRYAMKELGLSGKWFSIGGSYAGSLSAYYRLKHPELVSGALSSSGPVQARANFESYDLAVARGVGEECAAAMRKIVSEIEGAMKDASEFARIKALFGAEEVRDDVDFLYVVADMGAIAVQYGYRKQFCGKLLRDQSVEDYAEAGREMFELFGITAVQDSFQGAESENPDDYYESFGMRQWLYQSCTEYGYWQNAYHDAAVSVRSHLITPEYHDGVCERLFGITESVDTTKIDEEFYRPLLDPNQASRIFYTNGEFDPWADLSITRELGNDTNGENEYFTIAGASHCDDLGGRDSSSLRQAKQTFSALLKDWL